MFDFMLQCPSDLKKPVLLPMRSYPDLPTEPSTEHAAASDTSTTTVPAAGDESEDILVDGDKCFRRRETNRC